MLNYKHSFFTEFYNAKLIKNLPRQAFKPEHDVSTGCPGDSYEKLV